MVEFRLFEKFFCLARHVIQHPDECINCPNVGFCEKVTKIFFQHITDRKINYSHIIKEVE